MRQKGILCPFCSGKLRCTDSVPGNSCIIRYKRCGTCKCHIRTSEEVAYVIKGGADANKKDIIQEEQAS